MQVLKVYLDKYLEEFLSWSLTHVIPYKEVYDLDRDISDGDIVITDADISTYLKVKPKLVLTYDLNVSGCTTLDSLSDLKKYVVVREPVTKKFNNVDCLYDTLLIFNLLALKGFYKTSTVKFIETTKTQPEDVKKISLKNLDTEDLLSDKEHTSETLTSLNETLEKEKEDLQNAIEDMKQVYEDKLKQHEDEYNKKVRVQEMLFESKQQEYEDHLLEKDKEINKELKEKYETELKVLQMQLDEQRQQSHEAMQKEFEMLKESKLRELESLDNQIKSMKQETSLQSTPQNDFFKQLSETMLQFQQQQLQMQMQMQMHHQQQQPQPMYPFPDMTLPNQMQIQQQPQFFNPNALQKFNPFTEIKEAEPEKISRNNLQVSKRKSFQHGDVTVVFSTTPKSGGTTTTYMMATYLAQIDTSKRVCIVDMDVSNGTLSRQLFSDLPNMPMNTLTSLSSPDPYTIPLTLKDSATTIDIIPNFGLDVNMSNIVKQSSWNKPINTLREYYDYIFVDCGAFKLSNSYQLKLLTGNFNKVFVLNGADRRAYLMFIDILKQLTVKYEIIVTHATTAANIQRELKKFPLSIIPNKPELLFKLSNKVSVFGLQDNDYEKQIKDTLFSLGYNT